MTREMTRSRIIVILLFAITFTMIGWAAPVMYASYVPQNDIIEKHKFSAEDVSQSADSHYVCFDRTVYTPASGKTFTELYMVSNDGERVEIAANAEDRYFQRGRSAVVTELTLPNNLAVGEYKYLLIAKVELAEGRVTRTLAFESDTFTVDNGTASLTQAEAIDGC